MIVLVDTNILLDVIQDRKPHSDPAARVWKLVEERAIAGHVSAISFNNVFYIARKQVGGEKALEAVRLIRRVFQIVALDEFVIDRALGSPGSDFEDKDGVRHVCGRHTGGGPRNAVSFGREVAFGAGWARCWDVRIG